MRILAVGIATLDIVNYVDGYPSEDDEVRALSQRISRGGNATNTLVTLAQLEHDCAWAGVMAEDAASERVRQELQKYHIAMDNVVVTSGALPTSYVTLNQQNGSRTIVHYRDLDEYGHELFAEIDVHAYDWIHFEGRNVSALSVMMNYLHQQGYTNFSLEVEKSRQDIEQLFTMPALLMFSRAYVREVHKGSVRDFFNLLRQQGVRVPVYCAWGKAGGWAMDHSGKLFQQPAWHPHAVRDTLGAGDVFNAAVIDAGLNGKAVDETLAYACKLAGYKCGLEGFDGIAEVLEL